MTRHCTLEASMKKLGIRSQIAARSAVCSLFLFVLLSPLAFRQAAGSGGISGTIVDQTGAVIPNANITLTSSSTGIRKTATANASGNYAFLSLNPDIYSIKASHNEFQTVVHAEVNVTVDQTTPVNFKLHIGNVTQVVRVTGSAGLLRLQIQLLAN